jgi:hypothetical protein
MKHITHLATQIENALQQILQHDADTLARETGFVQRQRKLTGSTFAQMMVFGAASNPCPTYTDWTHAATCAGTPLTPQGIEQRFTPQAAHFLYALLQRFAARVITLCTPEVAPLLQRFAGVFIKDSTLFSYRRVSQSECVACVVRVVCEVAGCGAVALAVVGVARGCVGSEFAQGGACVSAVVCGVGGVLALWLGFRGIVGVV